MRNTRDDGAKGGSLRQRARAEIQAVYSATSFADEMRMLGPGKVIAAAKLETLRMVAHVNPRQNSSIGQIIEIAKYSYSVVAADS